MVGVSEGWREWKKIARTGTHAIAFGHNVAESQLTLLRVDSRSARTQFNDCVRAHRQKNTQGPLTLQVREYRSSGGGAISSASFYHNYSSILFHLMGRSLRDSSFCT